MFATKNDILKLRQYELHLSNKCSEVSPIYLVTAPASMSCFSSTPLPLLGANPHATNKRRELIHNTSWNEHLLQKHFYLDMYLHRTAECFFNYEIQVSYFSQYFRLMVLTHLLQIKLLYFYQDCGSDSEPALISFQCYGMEGCKRKCNFRGLLKFDKASGPSRRTSLSSSSIDSNLSGPGFNPMRCWEHTRAKIS